MCGIVAILKKDRSLGVNNIPQELNICRKMLYSLRHRGPDESSATSLGNACLGHTRLSIIDLSTGSQPIFNEDKSVAVILNGEIYNFLELREELQAKGHRFSTRSDTEVIVHLYEEVGEKVFSKLNGMFAIVIYDSVKNLMLAARDRIGEKPLLYWETKDKIVFSSEIKAILLHPEFERCIDMTALCFYLHLMYIPAPYTIFKHVKKLLPGHYLSICDGHTTVHQYWNPEVEIDWNLKEENIVEEFTNIFADAVKKRIISDVPIGVFLSGGIDSSAVTVFTALNSTEQVKTFSIGFGDEIDERPYARIVAERYNTQHHELFVKDNIEDVLEKVIAYFDEPFGDSSAVPTYLISKEARRHVKVILTGDGGDELFAGYSSYVDQKYQYRNRLLTKGLRTLNGIFVRTVGHNFFDHIYPRKAGKWADQHWRWVRTVIPEEEISKLLRGKLNSISQFFDTCRWLKVRGDDALTRAYSYDLNFYLPHDLLKKVDMASMFASLECRAPFLDHRLIELSLRIPPHLKVKADVLKYILKVALSDYLPREILVRAKTGFGAPISSWLTGQLREMVFDLLRSGCKCQQFFRMKMLKQTLDSVFGKTRNNDYRVTYRLWLILVLEVWLRSYY